MSLRKIVEIDEDKCDGCGLCVPACAEGAIQIIDGKAKLVADTYCDGLGACLGECPQGAISLKEREAAGYDEVAVQRHLKRRQEPVPLSHRQKPSCPGSALRQIAPLGSANPAAVSGEARSRLGHWPVQLMLVPPHAPFLKDADLLVCADCVPFAVPDFHGRYLAGRTVLVGCPKLDDLEYYGGKLRAILSEARPRRLTVLRMEVPCCGGIAQAVVEARNQAQRGLAIEVHTIGIRGQIVVETIPATTAA